MADSKMVKHMACPKCNSSDANTLYEDGHSYCFSCKTRFGVDMQEEVKVIPEMLNLLGCSKENFNKLLKKMDYKIY